MTEINPLNDQNQTPEDVATLYSWANLHGAKYRDFSAARAQTRESARLRAEQALAEEEQRRKREQAQGESETIRIAQAQFAEEEKRAAEQAAQALQAQLAAEQASQRAVQLAAENAARLEAERAARQAAQAAAEQAAQQAAAQRAVEQSAAQRAAERAQELAALQAAAEEAARQTAQQLAQQRAWQQPRPEYFAAPPPSVPPAPLAAPQAQGYEPAGFSRPQVHRPPPAQPPYAPVREEIPVLRNPWAAPEAHEPVERPAWLSPENAEPANPSALNTFVPPAPEDTLQGSRDRLASRWYALRGVFDGNFSQPEAAPAPVTSRAPSLAVFSLAGGVGKTSLVATLGRALSARGERVLLVDTAAFGLLPFFFGASDQRPGLLRTFTPPGVSSDAPIQMVTLDPEGMGADASSGQESLSAEISKFARGASRVIIDLATASGATTRRIMRMAPLVIVPVVPDMNSVVSVSSIDAFFEHNGSPAGKPSMPFYLLNQFDASLPLHLDVREVLREQLEERLLPFALRRTPAMSEALAEGMTVMDYAPGSTLAEDYVTLAGWVKSLSAPATTSYRGVRWSER